jgi:hypothetical protein
MYFKVGDPVQSKLKSNYGAEGSVIAINSLGKRAKFKVRWRAGGEAELSKRGVCRLGSLPAIQPAILGKRNNRPEIIHAGDNIDVGDSSRGDNSSESFFSASSGDDSSYAESER